MVSFFQGILAVIGRITLCLIFLLSAVGNHALKFKGTVEFMQQHKVPKPQVLLVGAIAFMILGSISVIVGYKARLGALLLFIFLALATYYFHDFWNYADNNKTEVMVEFLKNLSIMGAMLFIIANGAGPMSVDARLSKTPPWNRVA